MYSVAAPIWNQIAETQQLRTEWARERFPMDREQMNDAWDLESSQLKDQGVTSSAVRLAYLTVKPLLLENEAISQYIMDNERIDLRNALPDICTVREAVILASIDHPLTEEEESQLTDLLQSDFAGDDGDGDGEVIACIDMNPHDTILNRMNFSMMLEKGTENIKRVLRMFGSPGECITQDERDNAIFLLEDTLDKLKQAQEQFHEILNNPE